jgi:hypothetical protein
MGNLGNPNSRIVNEGWRDKGVKKRMQIASEQESINFQSQRRLYRARICLLLPKETVVTNGTSKRARPVTGWKVSNRPHLPLTVASVFEQQDPDHYKESARITTVKGARTGFFSPELDRLFLAVRRQGTQAAAIRVFASLRSASVFKIPRGMAQSGIASPVLPITVWLYVALLDQEISADVAGRSPYGAESICPRLEPTSVMTQPRVPRCKASHRLL